MSQQKSMRPLLMGHLLFVATAAVGCGYWIWRNTPARQLYAIYSSRRTTNGPLNLQPFFKASEALTGDIVFVALAFAMFTFGTRIYVKQFQTWLDARAAGDAASFGGQRLEDQAIAANNRVGVGQ